MFINGKWIKGTGEKEVKNPVNGELVDTVPTVGKQEVHQAVKAASEAFQSWSQVDPAERASYMYKVAELMRERKDEIARTATIEMGKSLVDMQGEVQSAIDYVQWNAEEAKRVYGEIIPSQPNQILQVLKQPRRVVADITD